MTTYPNAEYRPLAARQGQLPMARHDVICLHTMVGTLTSTDRMFHQNGWSGTESHFGVGGKWGDGLDGKVYQWQDTEFRADANLNGNHRVLSIETGDNFPRSAADIEPWTPKQLDAIVDLVAYLCRTYDIPAVLIPDSKPGRRGIGYHRQGVPHSGGTHPPGFLQPGGEVWSTSVGKECPGPARIAQMPEIVARVAKVLAGKEEDDMDWTDKIKLTEWDADAWGEKVGKEVTIGAMLRNPTAVRILDNKIDQVSADQVHQFTTLTVALGEIAKTLKDIAARLPPAAP